MIKRLLLLTLSSAVIGYSIFLVRELILYFSDYIFPHLLVVPISLGLQVLFSTLRINRIYSVVGIAFSIIFTEFILFSYLPLLSKIILVLGILLEIQIAVWPRKIIYQSLPIYLITLFYASTQLWGEPRIFLYCILLLVSLLLNSERKILGIFFTFQIITLSLTIFFMNIMIFIIGIILTIFTSLIYRFLLVRKR